MSSDEDKIRVVKNATDLQRLKLEKLMKNPEKPAFIPEKTKDKKFPKPPEFVRNVMGSSAGAGSGEFHVYRHIRRREYARQEYLNQMSEKDRLDEEYKEKIIENKRVTEEKSAKKRGKRQRAKQRQREKKRRGPNSAAVEREDESDDSSAESDGETRGCYGDTPDGVVYGEKCTIMYNDSKSKPKNTCGGIAERISTDNIGEDCETGSDTASADDNPHVLHKKSLKELLIKNTGKLVLNDNLVDENR